MELFKNTNFDFLGKKWPFIIASLVLTVAGLASILMQGGLKYGIDFKGGTLMTVKFAEKPPIEQIRSAFGKSGKIKGEVTVQNFTDPQTQNEVEIGTELEDERQLAANRQAMEEVLAATFGQPGSGKLDFNNGEQGGAGGAAARRAGAQQRGDGRAAAAETGRGHPEFPRHTPAFRFDHEFRSIVLRARREC